MNKCIKCIYFLVKLVTKELIGFEGQLLKGYKVYLTNLEKMAGVLHKKKGDTRVVTNVSINELTIFKQFIFHEIK